MEFSKYNPELQQLISEIRLAAQEPGTKAIRLLRKLEKREEMREDDSLHGLLHYLYADMWQTRKDRERFMKHLRRSVGYFLRTDEKEDLARAYNLFAVDAHQKGCFDVAYDYYYIARSFVEGGKDSLAYAMIEANIGDLQASVGEYRSACACIRKCLPIIRRHKEEAMWQINTVMAMLNIGLSEVSAGRLDKAERIIEDLDRNNGEKWRDAGEMAAIMVLLLRIRLALAKGERERMIALAEEVRQGIRNDIILVIFKREIYELCRAMIYEREMEVAGSFLDVIESQTETNVYTAMLFTRLRVAYHRHNGDREQMLACYAKCHALQKEHLQVQKEVYYDSIGMMQLLEDLREEEMRQRKGNLDLQKQAETDVLTGLPNRYALNRHLEEVYARALETQGRVAVGIADIDHFKQYNDTYGHQMGDECLMRVAGNLSRLAKEYGFFASRYGGDEFVLVYENISDKEIRNIEKEITSCEDISISHGFYAAVPGENTRLWDFFSEADKKLYRKKKR